MKLTVPEAFFNGDVMEVPDIASTNKHLKDKTFLIRMLTSVVPLQLIYSDNKQVKEIIICKNPRT